MNEEHEEQIREIKVTLEKLSYFKQLLIKQTEYYEQAVPRLFTNPIEGCKQDILKEKKHIKALDIAKNLVQFSEFIRETTGDTAS